MLFSLSLIPGKRPGVQHGIKGVCGAVYEQLNFHTIIQDTNKDQQWNEILKYGVLSRVAHPDSKRKTVETLKEDYNETAPLEKIYRMMDRLYPHIQRVKDLVAENTLHEGKIKEDSRWDGLSGVISNMEDKSAEQLLNRRGFSCVQT